MVKKGNAIETIITAIHEARHAYQGMICEGKIKTIESINHKRIETWKTEFYNYKTPNGSIEKKLYPY